MKNDKNGVYSYLTNQGKRYYFKYKGITRRGFLTFDDAIVAKKSLMLSAGTRIQKRIKCGQLDNAFKEWLFQRQKRTTASKNYVRYKLHIHPFFKDFYTDSVDNSLIILFNDKINALQTTEKVKILSLFKNYLLFMVRYGLKNCDSQIVQKYQDKNFIEPEQFDFYTYSEFKLFLSVITRKRDRLIFIILFHYGLRIGELRGLKWKDITKTSLSIKRQVTNHTEDAGAVELAPKSKKSIRDFPMIDIFESALEEYKKELRDSHFAWNKEDYLFFSITPGSNTIGANTIYVLNRNYSAKAGLRRIKIHEFRHSCASDLINNKIPLEVISIWMGHDSAATTARIYAHLLPSAKLEISSFLNKRKLDYG